MCQLSLQLTKLTAVQFRARVCLVKFEFRYISVKVAVDPRGDLSADYFDNVMTTFIAYMYNRTDG